MTFQIHALKGQQFDHYFAMSDEALAKIGARRVVADAASGFPCRISLADAEPGDTLILVNFTHLDMPSAYASKHAIYVREGVEEMVPEPGEVPRVLSSRLLSVRAFDEAGFMRVAEVVEGSELSGQLEAMFCDGAVSFIDIHNAKQGCFAARVTRAG